MAIAINHRLSKIVNLSLKVDTNKYLVSRLKRIQKQIEDSDSALP